MIEGTSFNEYFQVFRIPLVSVIAWSVLSLVLSFVKGVEFLFYVGWIGIIVAFCAWLYCGWFAVKKHGFGLTQSVLAGVIGGLIAGAVGGILGVIQLLYAPTPFPEMIGGAWAVFGTMTASATSSLRLVLTALVSVILGMVVGGVLSGVGAFAASNIK